MHAHDEHGDGEIFRGPDLAARADALWHAQPRLAIADAGRLTASRADRNTRAEVLAAEVAGGQAALGGRVYRVRTAALADLRTAIERLDRRAARLGTGPIALRQVAAHDSHTLVVLSGRPPVLAGWSLAAIVEHRERGSALRPVNEHGERLSERDFAEPRCEHCDARRRRVETFVVVHASTGSTRQVGSNCLRDFLGGNDPDRACRQAEYLAAARETLSDAERPASRQPPRAAAGLPLHVFAACAACALRADGWVSRERARRSGREASADAALRALEAGCLTTRADRALAAGALRWARILLASKPEPTAFERDAAALATGGITLARRERGLLCALIAVYRRRRADSRHLAEIGAWIEVAVLVERVVERPSPRHGSIRRCEFIDADVNRMVWWQTTGAPLPEGELVVLRARVDRHARFGAIAVTVLTRCHRLGTPGTATMPLSRRLGRLGR